MLGLLGMILYSEMGKTEDKFGGEVGLGERIRSLLLAVFNIKCT